MNELSDAQKQAVIQRARTDADAHKSGWPVMGCPYSGVREATLWKKIFDKAVAEMRDKQ